MHKKKGIVKKGKRQKKMFEGKILLLLCWLYGFWVKKEGEKTEFFFGSAAGEFNSISDRMRF